MEWKIFCKDKLRSGRILDKILDSTCVVSVQKSAWYLYILHIYLKDTFEVSFSSYIYIPSSYEGKIHNPL